MAVSGKLWGMGAGLVTTLFVAAFFAPEVQGYHYTFLSILALQVFAELGLGVVITTYASHEWSRLALDARGHIVGDSDSVSRLASLARFAVQWYLAAACLVTVVLALGGLCFFASTGWAERFLWGAPWAALCLVAGANLCFIPFWALLEGCNQISAVYTFRLLQSVLSSVVGWLAISLGAGLWVAPTMGVAGACIAIFVLWTRHRRFFRSLLHHRAEGPRLGWRHDIFPMQWRLALSWLSGYFAFSLFTPVLFHYQGPTVAGQMGMTWSLVGLLTGISSSWIAPKAPVFGSLIAQHRFAELDRAFWRLTVVVTLVATLTGLAIWLGVSALGQWRHPFAARLLNSTDTGYFILANIIVAASLPMSAYLRAHKKEPLLAVSLISGVATGTAVVVLGKYYSSHGVAIGYLVVTALITPFVALVWCQRRAEWHGHGFPGGLKAAKPKSNL